MPLSYYCWYVSCACSCVCLCSCSCIVIALVVVIGRIRVGVVVFALLSQTLELELVLAPGMVLVLALIFILMLVFVFPCICGGIGHGISIYAGNGVYVHCIDSCSGAIDRMCISAHAFATLLVGEARLSPVISLLDAVVPILTAEAHSHTLDSIIRICIRLGGSFCCGKNGVESCGRQNV